MSFISRVVYLILRCIIYVIYPKTKIFGAENLPDEGAILVGNHTKMNGPIIAQLYLPGKNKIWCASQMMTMSEVPAYAYKDFWSGKPKWIQWFYKMLSHIIAPLAVIIFKNADTIPVYRDLRLKSTFRMTEEYLQEGNNIVIFPEHYKDHNNIINDFQDRFIDIARFYYKKTGKKVSFVPLYNAPMLHSAYIGKPITYDENTDIKIERKRICDYLMDEITAIAVSLPKHKVVTYANLRKKDYPYNKD